MGKEYPCVYYDNEKCKKFSDEEVTSWCVQAPCPDETPSNGDWLRSLDDEALAEFLEGEYGNFATDWALPWLKQPHEQEV